ncbi:MAG: cytochrome c-type biogenesis protein CcmH [Candidatus Rokubacteria bacterium]|nr:cytochrome c-type biogenesis protein CcmH [Candidatus Rokubacteria bacterium]
MSPSRACSVLVAVLAAVVLLAPAFAATGDDDVERRMLEVASGLRCPVCQNLSVADSTSEMAREMRSLIVDELRAGKSPEQIRAYFVEKYGQWILLSPTPKGFGLLVWVLPVVASVAGLAVAAWVLTGWTRRRARPVPAPLDDARRARLRQLATAEALPADVSADEIRALDALSELEFDHRAGKLSARDYEELRALYEARAVEEARVSARARAERRVAELEARTAALLSGAAAPEARRRPRRWRWAAAGVFVVVFGVALTVFLAGAVRPRDAGGITGDPLTGTAAELMASRDVPALLGAGQAAIGREDYREATALFRRVLEIDAAEPTANAYLGLILHRTGRGAEALAAFERALARDPISAPALWGKGLVLYETMNRPADALHVWQTLLSLKLSDEDRRHVSAQVSKVRQQLDAGAGPRRSGGR